MTDGGKGVVVQCAGGGSELGSVECTNGTGTVYT
jgi:hypothetical protein